MLTTSSGEDKPAQVSQTCAPEDAKKLASAFEGAGFANSTPAALRPGRLQKNWALLRKLHRATLIARQQGLELPTTAAKEAASDDLRALQQVAKQGEEQKARQIRDGERSSFTTDFQQFGYAAPLSPLRERDEVALDELFQRSDMLAIETDISSCLLKLMPEPCWDDDPFEFIREFL